MEEDIVENDSPAKDERFRNFVEPPNWHKSEFAHEALLALEGDDRNPIPRKAIMVREGNSGTSDFDRIKNNFLANCLRLKKDEKGYNQIEQLMSRRISRFKGLPKAYGMKR